MHKINIFLIIVLKCLAAQAMNQNNLESTLFASLSPHGEMQIKKMETPRTTMYKVSFFNGDQLTCTRDRYFRTIALLDSVQTNSNHKILVDSQWYGELAKVYEQRKRLQQIANDKLTELWIVFLQEELLLGTNKFNPKRKQLYEYYIENWHLLLKIINFLETPFQSGSSTGKS